MSREKKIYFIPLLGGAISAIGLKEDFDNDFPFMFLINRGYYAGVVVEISELNVFEEDIKINFSVINGSVSKDDENFRELIFDIGMVYKFGIPEPAIKKTFSDRFHLNEKDELCLNIESYDPKIH